jgi:uncharacterized membrane protein YsdA (DUF1294 family)
MDKQEKKPMQIWTIVVIVYLTAMNIAGFCVCAADKRAAVRHRRRVPERTLFALALIFGSAGVHLAMLVMSHKTRKLKFTVLMPTILAAQAALLCWIFWKLA